MSFRRKADRLQQKIGIAYEMLHVRRPELLERRCMQNLEDQIREQGFPSEDLLNEYEAELPLLREIFGTPEDGLNRDILFHGTGLKKYAVDKYNITPESQEHSSECVPVLERILDEGLIVHQDPWLPTGEVQSASFAVSYFYAKWYSDKYTGTDTTLEYKFGDTLDWFLYYMKDTMYQEFREVISGERQFDVTQLYQRKKESDSLYTNKLYHWIASLRHDASENTSMINILQQPTDITDNWGAVLCFDRKAIQTFQMSFGDTHEVRTDKPVSPDFIKALGVPRQHLGTARDLLAAAGRNIPLFALECADMHLVDFDFTNLIRRVEKDR